MRYEITILAAVLMLLCFFLAAAAGDAPQGNLAVLREIAADPLAQKVDSLVPRAANLTIVLEEENPLGEWLKIQVAEAALSEGYTLFDAAGEPDEPGYQVIIAAAGADITYAVADRNLLFRVSRYRRTVRSTVLAQIITPDERIAYTGTLEKQFEDLIDSGDIGQVENTLYSFSVGTKTESRFIKRLVEPVLITATTVGVVYLFYTLRSSSE